MAYKKRDITEEARLEKNSRIKESFQATRLRRESQSALTVILKVDLSKYVRQASGKKSKNRCKSEAYTEKKRELRKELYHPFAVGRWTKNYIVGQSKSEPDFDVFKFELGNEITHKDKDMNDVVEQIHVGSQIKQSIVKSIRDEIRGLSAKKKKGYKVGSLKFVSEYNSIQLKQYGNTYSIVRRTKNLAWVRVQGMKHLLPCRGVQQLDDLKKQGLDYEYSSGKLIKQGKDVYLAITVFVDTKTVNAIKENKITNEDIEAYDGGCMNAYTDTQNRVYKCKVEETERLKNLQTKLHGQKKGSNRRWKTKQKIRVEYQKLNNRKNDIANKIFSKMMRNRTIVVQDEQLSSWHEDNHGKAVQHSCLGRVKSKLEREHNLSGRVVILNKWLPTTKFIFEKGIFMNLSERDRNIRYEDLVVPRDQHSAQCMLWFYEHNIGIGKDSDLSFEDIRKAIADAIARDNSLGTDSNKSCGEYGTYSASTNARSESSDSKREAPTL